MSVNTAHVLKEAASTLVCEVNGTNHGEARQECRGPAGGLQLGPAQVELPPRQGLDRVVVGADELQVAASHPVPVVHPTGLRRPLRDPRGRGAHGHVQLTAHGTWWMSRGETVNTTLCLVSPPPDSAPTLAPLSSFLTLQSPPI